jgi:hypothetical protein
LPAVTKTVVLLTLASACATPARRPTPAPLPVRPDPACEAALRDGRERLEAGDWPGAVERFRAARGQCTDPRPAAMELAHALLAVDDSDGAAEVLADLITSPEPPLQSYAELRRALDTASPTERERISRLGSTAERPLHVPSPELEYSWIGTFSCPEGHARILSQRLVGTSESSVDVLEFTCGDSSLRTVFFATKASPSAPRG